MEQGTQTEATEDIERKLADSISRIAELEKAIKANTEGTLVYIPGTSFSAYTDATGRFALGGLPPGSYQLNFQRDGFAVTRAVQDANLAVKIIILTSHKNEELFHSALDLGVAGYVLKDGAIVEIVNAIRAVAAGRNYFSPELSTFLLNRASRSARLVQRKPTINDLSPAEQRVLKLIAEEKTSKEIAEILYISLRTVEHHRSHICEKLDLHGFNALVRFAITHKSELS